MTRSMTGPLPVGVNLRFRGVYLVTSGPQTLARGPSLARNAFLSGPHGRVNNNRISANFLHCR